MSWQSYERARRPRRRKRSSWLFSCVAATAIIVAAVVVGALIALGGRDEPPALTGDDRERIAVELRGVKQAVEDIRKDAELGVARSFTIAVTDDQLNLWLSEDAEVRRTLTERNIEDAWVRIHDGAMHVTVLRSVGSLTVQMKASLGVEIAGSNEVRVHIKDMAVGRLGAPPAAAERLADQIGRLITNKIRRPNVTLETVQIAENRVEITGRTGSSDTERGSG